MSSIAMAFGIGLLIGIALFLILAFSGYIDKWSGYIEKWSGWRRPK
jgi:hypothetical protein